jgi:SAM-dependent methyltransferase
MENSSQIKKETQTSISFSDKWNNNPNLAFVATLNESSEIFKWILTRNGFAAPEALCIYLQDKKRILDAGCGNGRVTALLHRYASITANIIGIDLVSAGVAQENLASLERVKIHAKDILEDLSELGQFDFIYCQEVLHHTSNPKKAFLNLCKSLSINGEIAIYVYKKKAPIREYADDFIRDRISSLPYEKAIELITELTNFGAALSALPVKVQVPKVQLLEIEAGEYEVQRLIYHFFLKCFWNSDLSFEENVAINYDWYHPQLCTRHTVEEIQSWFAEANLGVVHQYVDYYGITMRGKKVSRELNDVGQET